MDKTVEEEKKDLPPILETVEKMKDSKNVDETLSTLDDDDLDEAFDILSDQALAKEQEDSQEKETVQETKPEEQPKEEEKEEKNKQLEEIEKNLSQLNFTAVTADIQKKINDAIQTVDQEIEKIAQQYQLIKTKLQNQDLPEEELVELKVQIKDLEKNYQQLAGLKEGYKARAGNLSLIQKYLTPEDLEDFNIDRLAQALRDDGLDESIIAKFKQDPLGTATAWELIQLVRRINAEEALKTMAEAMKALKEENERLKSGQKNTIKKAAQIMKTIPEELEKTNGSVANEQTSLDKPVEQLSDEELNRLFKQLTIN